MWGVEAFIFREATTRVLWWEFLRLCWEIGPHTPIYALHVHDSCASGSAEIDGMLPAVMATLTNLATSDKFDDSDKSGDFED